METEVRVKGPQVKECQELPTVTRTCEKKMGRILYLSAYKELTVLTAWLQPCGCRIEDGFLLF